MSKFSLGCTVMTCGVNALMKEDSAFYQFAVYSLLRYYYCDWGDTCEAGKAQNDNAVANGDDRILAEYRHPDHPDWRLWIITEWDRSATTLLFPSEY